MAKEDSLQDIFKELLADPKLYAALRPAFVINAWEETVGGMVSKRTNPISLEKGVLLVNVSSHSMLTELELSKNMILEKYQKRFGKRIIKDIQFKIGKITKKVAASLDTNQPAKTKMPIDIIKNALPLSEDVTHGVSEEVLNELGPTLSKINAAIEWNNKNNTK